MNKNRLQNIGSGISVKLKDHNAKQAAVFQKSKTDAGSCLNMGDYK